MKAKILLIEGKRSDRPSFVVGLTRKGYQVESAVNGSEALARLEPLTPDLIIVNAASMRTSGKRICQSIRAHAQGAHIVLITDAQNVEMIEREELADVVLTLPFTLQKLMNRIRPLLPTDKKDLLELGPLLLAPSQRWVRKGTRQTSLTPRLVMLLKILMEQPGIVVERELLFKKVWDTTYTEDTRTLDVHISWLRRAIEDDPRNPQIIKTIRGVGYRLDIDEQKR
ncbi:MAG: response regulator transcription factor [Anaerolineaceae bacterium]|nr:response regulator transcription factor [Anaerolineaceae bacterium]